MKKIVILVIGVFILLPAQSQFQVSHGTEANEEGRSVRMQLFDRGFIIGGFTDIGIFTAIDATLVRTQFDGSIVWSKVYGIREGEELINSVRPIYPEEDAGYVCLGTTNSFGYGTNDMFFMRVDPMGVPVSVRTYGGKYGDEGHCIQVINDEETGEYGLIMIGESASFTGLPKMFVVKTDLDGNYQNAAIIGTEGSQYGYWIEQTRDGGYIAVGANDFACGLTADTSNLDIFVVKLFPDLSIEWSRTIGGGPDLPFDDIAYSVKEIEEGYIITGNTISFGFNNTQDAFMLKLDSSGGFQWLRNYGYLYTDGANDVLSEENTGINHQYIFAGYTWIERYEYALLVATNYNGDIMWNRAYGKKGYQIASEMDKILLPGYVFTGFETSFGPGQRSIYHVTTNDIGDSGCPTCEIEPPIKSEKHEPCISEEVFSERVETGLDFDIEFKDIDYKTVSCEEVTTKSTEEEKEVKESHSIGINSLSIYPNPANQKVNVQYPESYQFGQLRVYNNTGQLVYSKVLTETNSTDISLANFESGIYMVTVVREDGRSLTTNLLTTR